MGRVAGLALAVVVALVLGACSFLAGDTQTSTPGAQVGHTTSGPSVPTGWQGGTVDVADLPPEAIDTLRLIADGGPFPYDQDGATFQNREGLLPGNPRGYYREYTVETPGSPDRGPRRIVTGADGERYYTADHYDSFRFVVGEPGR